MSIPKISLKNAFSLITKPSNIGPAGLIIVGSAKTAKDYIDAPYERKQRVLIKDSSVLAGSFLAFALAAPLSTLLCKAKVFSSLVKPIKNIFKHIFKSDIKNEKFINGTKKVVAHTDRIINESFAATINTFAGIFGAVSANELVHKYLFSKKSFIREKPKEETVGQNHLENQTNEQNHKKGFFKSTEVFDNFNYATPKVVKEASDRIWATLSDVPEMKVLSGPMIVLTGFSVANTNGYENKLQKNSYELIANTFIPTAFVTAASIAVEEKRALIKYPVLFLGLLVGSIAGKYGGEKVNKYLSNKYSGLKNLLKLK